MIHKESKWWKLHLDVSLLLAELLRQGMATTRGYDDPECSARENWNLDLSKAASMFLVMSAFQVSYLCPLYMY